jgi:hypothetical protein
VANLTQEQLRRLARLGAAARLSELRDEVAAIHRAFPELSGRGAGRQAAAQAPRRRRRMSAAQRKAVADRMRKYWAERRKAKAAKAAKAGK